MITVQELADRYGMSETCVRKVIRSMGIKTACGQVIASKSELLDILHNLTAATSKEAHVASCTVSGSISYRAILQKTTGNAVYAVYRGKSFVMSIPCSELEDKHNVRVEEGVYLTWLEDDEIVEFHKVANDRVNRRAKGVVNF